MIYTIIELLDFIVFVIRSIFFVEILFHPRFVNVFSYLIAKISNVFV